MHLWTCGHVILHNMYSVIPPTPSPTHPVFRKKHVHRSKTSASACLQRSGWAPLWIFGCLWACFTWPGPWCDMVWWHVIPSLIDIQYLQSFSTARVSTFKSQESGQQRFHSSSGTQSHMFDQNCTDVQSFWGSSIHRSLDFHDILAVLI